MYASSTCTNLNFQVGFGKDFNNSLKLKKFSGKWSFSELHSVANAGLQHQINSNISYKVKILVYCKKKPVLYQYVFHSSTCILGKVKNIVKQLE